MYSRIVHARNYHHQNRRYFQSQRLAASESIHQKDNRQQSLKELQKSSLSQ